MLPVLPPFPSLPLPLNAEVRDAWAPHHNPVTPTPTEPVVSYESDTWDDAGLEEVMAWLERYLNARRTETPVM